MTRAKLLRAAADSIEMQEKAGIFPVGKVIGCIFGINCIDFSGLSENYEFPLAVVEGKAVFKGDQLFHPHYGGVIVGTPQPNGFTVEIAPDNAYCFSWNPPKPRTVMVELSYDDAAHWSGYWDTFNNHKPSIRLYAACRKALEEVKNG